MTDGIILYTLLPTKRFEKSLKRIDRSQVPKILAALKDEDFRKSPKNHKNVKLLRGELEGAWRLEVGQYRVIFEINDDELVIIAVKAGSREGIYG